MKILLFNLGSVEHRIINWDVEGYKSLFENDVILWGPIPDKEFSIAGKNIQIISFSEPLSIKDVFRRLPDGWVPDIVTCDTSALIYVNDLYLCPVRTILFTRDAWADTIFNRNLVELFDFVSHSIVDFKAYDGLKTKILPLSSFPVSLPDPEMPMPEFAKRKIDVIAIANYNEGFYHERYRTIFRLAADNTDHFRIRYLNGLKRKEIHEYYRRSKIVIDWAHTLSNRSYEAALNGCLLFTHEDNTAMSSFWEPWKEYIPYNEKNLYDQIRYFINNPARADEIILRTGERIKSMPVSFGQYTLANIDIAISAGADVQSRIDRCLSLTRSDLAYRTSTPFAYNYRYETRFPGNWEDLYFERIDVAITPAAGDSDLIRPVIEAARIAFLSGRFELCSGYLGRLEKLIPDYAWIYYLRGRISLRQKDYIKAIEYLEKAIEYATKAPGPVREYILPFIEKELDIDGRRITDYLWQPVYNHNNEFQVKALIHLSACLKGDIYQMLNEGDKAIKEYLRAVEYLAVADSVKKAAPMLLKSHNFNTLLEITEKGIADSPYDNQVVLYKAYALIQLGKRREAYHTLKIQGKALKSFPGTRTIEYLQKIITIPALAGFISRKAACRALEVLINKLNK